MKPKKLGRDPLQWIHQTKEDVKPQEEQPLEQIITPSRLGRPQTIKREYEKSSQEGLPENWTRATFILREDLLKKLKDYAYTDRRTLKEIVSEMVESYLKDKETIERNETS